MLRIASAQLWVHDQEVALKFWTGNVGMEVREDVSLPELGNFRWLTVGPPVLDETTKADVLNVVAKGFAATLFLTTDDCQATYDELSARGVEFTEPPHEMPYGNSVRLTQRTELPAS